LRGWEEGLFFLTKIGNGFLIKVNSGEATDAVTEGMRHTLLNRLHTLEAMLSYQAMEREKLIESLTAEASIQNVFFIVMVSDLHSMLLNC
jgi:hypothetical protein